MGAKSLTRQAAKLYDEDFVEWASETARLLREGRFDRIDVEHLVEEVEDMASRDKRELLSRLIVLLQHLLKWQHQPENRSGSWKATVLTQRTELELLFEQSPSLKRIARGSAPRAYRKAVAAAAAATGLPVQAFPSECRFSLEQILDETFLPGR